MTVAQSEILKGQEGLVRKTVTRCDRFSATYFQAMILPAGFRDAVREWYEKNGDVELTKANGKTELMKTYQQLVPGKDTKQANMAVVSAIRKIRPVIAPSHSRVRFKRRTVGQPTSSHPDEIKKVNAINIPISSARKKAKLGAEHTAEIIANPLISGKVLKDDELKGVVQCQSVHPDPCLSVCNDELCHFRFCLSVCADIMCQSVRTVSLFGIGIVHIIGEFVIGGE